MTRTRSKSAPSYATLAGALALTLFAGRARADAVPPPPTDCAAGSQGNSCHGGTYCTPASTCTTSADCTGGEVCQKAALCIGQVDCYGGILTDGGPTSFPQESVEGLCTAGTCDPDGGATCTTLSLCVSPGGGGGSSGSSSSGGSPVVEGGCSCKTSGASRGSLGLAMVAVAVGLGLTRRRRTAGDQRPARQRRA